MFTHAARGGAAGIAVASGCWGAAKGGRPGGAVTVVHSSGARRRGWHCGRLRLLGRGKRWTAWRCSNGCSPMRRAAARLGLRSPQAAGAPSSSQEAMCNIRITTKRNQVI
ncbi:hypothetical protein HZS92_01540 [Xanthomonas citri pv. citri]|nr:hypothetical protein HZS92_01540 [Xanthomonas citri pv. citri]